MTSSPGKNLETKLKEEKFHCSLDCYEILPGNRILFFLKAVSGSVKYRPRSETLESTRFHLQLDGQEIDKRKSCRWIVDPRSNLKDSKRELPL